MQDLRFHLLLQLFFKKLHEVVVPSQKVSINSRCQEDTWKEGNQILTVYPLLLTTMNFLVKLRIDYGNVEIHKCYRELLKFYEICRHWPVAALFCRNNEKYRSRLVPGQSGAEVQGLLFMVTCQCPEDYCPTTTLGFVQLI